MVRGSTVKLHFLIAASAAALIGAVNAPLPARAADLGGDCCADLEERVAELEATTVRKGNKKVTIELYGNVNKAVVTWDDGVEQNTYVEDNGYKTTRFGFRGKAKITGDWSGGYRIEVETRIARSRNLDQLDDDNTDNSVGSLATRHSYIYLANKEYGELRWGLTSTPKDDITKDTHVAGTSVIDTMHSDFFFNNNFFLRSELVPDGQSLSNIRWQDLERCYSSSSAVFDCSTRRNMVVGQTKKCFDTGVKDTGLWFAWGWGEDDIWSGSARYKGEWDNWKLGAGVAYENFSDERVNNAGGGIAGFQQDLHEWGGEASLLHKPTGLWANFSLDHLRERLDECGSAYSPADRSRRRSPGMSPAASRRNGGISARAPCGAAIPKSTVWSASIYSSPAPSVWSLPAASPALASTRRSTNSEVSKWYIAFDQELELAAMDIYIGYQHISGDLDLVDSALNPIAAPFYDFDVVFSGARIYF